MVHDRHVTFTSLSDNSQCFLLLSTSHGLVKVIGTWDKTHFLCDLCIHIQVGNG